jgi:serine phosphatase RsbU (regulator of sigma subunit)/anti-sigma regulatory factor (Ser/Thr protein kinase)
MGSLLIRYQGMSTKVTPQKINLFDHFIRQWRSIIGSELLVISAEGAVLTQTNGFPWSNWEKLVPQFSPHQPTCLTASGQTLVAVPLCDDQQCLGYLLAPNATERDLSMLVWGAEIIKTRLIDDEALRGMTDELIGAWEQLELIYRVTQNLTLTSDLLGTLKSILQEIRKVVNTEDGFILLQRQDSLDCVTCDTHHLEPHLGNDTLLNNLIKANQVVLCDISSGCHHIWPDAPDSVETLLATHLLITDEDSQAALGLVNKANTKFTAGDVKLLLALTQQVGAIIKNFLVHQRLVIEQRLSRELEIAAEIQESLLPTTLPQVGGLSISVVYLTASEVGGDFYDFITLDDRHLTVVIGDVAGKGVPAAMLTSVTRTMLRVEAMRGEPPHTIIHRANNILHEDLSRADSFVTAFVAIIDTIEGSLSYASAGHTPVILWRAETQTTEQLKATSPPIGIYGYRGDSTRTVTLEPGDTILFYTDGIIEAQSPEGELFGIGRLLQSVREKAYEPPEVLQEYIQTEITNFCHESFSRDDATLLVVKMLPQVDVMIPKPLSKTVKMVDFSYPADIKHLTDISQEIIHTCRQVPALPPGHNANDFIYLIELAISEICTNIIQHAYAGKKGQINGHITLLENGVILDFFDTGSSFDPTSVPEPRSDPTHLPEGGYGLHIVRQIMDIVSYAQHPERGNHWHLEKFIRPLDAK